MDYEQDTPKTNYADGDNTYKNLLCQSQDFTT